MLNPLVKGTHLEVTGGSVFMRKHPGGQVKW